MTRPIRALLLIAGALAVAGWATESLALTVLAPVPLLALPLALQYSPYSTGRFRDDPLQPIWLLTALFGFTYLLVPALSAIDPDSFASLPGILDTPPTQRLWAVWLSALGFLALMAGYYGGLGRRFAGILPRGPSIDQSTRWLGIFAAILFTVGTVSVIAAIQINNGFALSPWELVTSNLRSSVVASYTGRGYLSIGFAILALSVPCAAIWASSTGGKLPWAAVAAVFAAALIMLFGILGSRLSGTAAIAGLLVVVHYRVRRFTGVEIVGATLSLLALGIGLRLAREGGNADPVSALGTLAGTLDGFNFLVNALGRVQDFVWGQTVGEDVVFTYLPRSVWADKPTIYGILHAQELIAPGLYDKVGRDSTYPPGILAEGYVNFGIAGALAFPFLAGIAIRAAYVRLVEMPTAFYVLFMAWLIPNLLSFMRGLGPMLPAAALTVIVLCPLLINVKRAPAVARE